MRYGVSAYNAGMITNFTTENFTLLLSGGGALGTAQPGVLHDLGQHRIVPKEIAGIFDNIFKEKKRRDI